MEGGNDLCFSTSVTTASRVPVKWTEEYFFIDRQAFENMVAQGELLEHAQYVSNFYGTPRKYVEDKLNEGVNVVLDIEVQGARQVREKMPEAIKIFIVPPSFGRVEAPPAKSWNR